MLHGTYCNSRSPKQQGEGNTEQNNRTEHTRTGRREKGIIATLSPLKGFFGSRHQPGAAGRTAITAGRGRGHRSAHGSRFEAQGRATVKYCVVVVLSCSVSCLLRISWVVLGYPGPREGLRNRRSGRNPKDAREEERSEGNEKTKRRERRRKERREKCKNRSDPVNSANRSFLFPL